MQDSMEMNHLRTNVRWSHPMQMAGQVEWKQMVKSDAKAWSSQVAFLQEKPETLLAMSVGHKLHLVGTGETRALLWRNTSGQQQRPTGAVTPPTH